MVTTGAISIHAAREGGDTDPAYQKMQANLFQSTPPVKAATRSISGFASGWNISIHAAREGGDAMAEQWGILI